MFIDRSSISLFFYVFCSLSFRRIYAHGVVTFHRYSCSFPHLRFLFFSYRY